jgi:hypothetical protein
VIVSAGVNAQCPARIVAPFGCEQQATTDLSCRLLASVTYGDGQART